MYYQKAKKANRRRKTVLLTRIRVTGVCYEHRYLNSSGVNKTAAIDICILQSTSSGFSIMSNLLNIHDFGLSEALGGHESPRITSVLVGPKPPSSPRGASWSGAVDSGPPSESECGSCHTWTPALLHVHTSGGCVCAQRGKYHTHSLSHANTHCGNNH